MLSKISGRKVEFSSKLAAPAIKSAKMTAPR